MVNGTLFLGLGVIAMLFPLFFTIAITRFLGVFALVSGGISLAFAVFGKESNHRVLEAISGVIRVVAGMIILNCLPTSVAMITLVFGIFLVTEGVFFVVSALRMRQHQGWVWSLVNGVVAVVIGIMVFNRWPSDALHFLGLFFGINALFTGLSLLMLAMGLPSAGMENKAEEEEDQRQNP
jgi:uncharacterized membrane protein HdeD (DUF308 family)